ncbi:glycoside hydrolase superfamily [Obelidium mucronatum]|nr:glycoside hydrolase superfamily [Obelidium mucronatum]
MNSRPCSLLPILLLLLPSIALADVCSLTRKVNAYRASFKLAPLVLDVRLVQVAQDHSEEMSLHSVKNEREASNLNFVKQQQQDDNNADINTKKSDAWYASIESLIPNWTFLAENVAMGLHDENQILDLFKNTRDYNENLLSEEATLLGIGEKDGYWTIEFAGTSDATDHPWYNATLYAQKNVAKLTYREKMDMIMGIGWAGGPCVGNVGPVPSIGFKGLCLNDAPMGVHWVENVTAFPSGLNLAATFDKELMLEYGKAMGREFREVGVNIQLGPAVNLIRAPAAGRNWEGPGGDPYLAAISSSLVVRGIQSNGVIATVKHLIGNEQEHFRDRSSSNIDKKTLMEMYMMPFDACIKEGVGAIMCSYNKLNQIYTCANSELVNDIIKGPDLDFRGIIITDWYAQYDLLVSDLIMPGAWAKSRFPWWYWTPFLSKVPFGGQFFPSYQPIPVSRLDDMVTRILSTYYALGQDKDYPATNFNAFEGALERGLENREYRFKVPNAGIARKVASASTVLVKNRDGLLPLRNEPGVKIAVLGEDARAPVELNGFADRNGNDGTLAQGWGSGTAQFPYLISPLEGISTRGDKLQIESSFDNRDIKRAQEIASKADYAIVFGNADSGEMIMWSVVEGNWGDRNDLNLWHGADALIEAVAAVNNQTIVVLHTVGPVNMPWFNHPNISAVLYAMLPGQESGSSLADILFGDVNPSGRLPFTVLENRSQYAADVLYTSFQYTPQLDYSEGLYIDYRHADKFNITPVVPFGHGLSYTQFRYSNLQVSTAPDSAASFPDITISLDIQNTGSTAGHEVVQLYVSYPKEANEPPQILEGFEKVWVDARQVVAVEFRLTARDLRVWGVDIDGWMNVAGKYSFRVGASSRDIRLVKELMWH